MQTAFRSRNNWRTIHNQRVFLDELGKKFGINNLDDWQEITVRKIEQVQYQFSFYYKNGGKGLLSLYDHSLFRTLQALHPHHFWDKSKFRNLKQVPQGFWKKTSNQRKYFDKLTKKLGIKKPSDWVSLL